MMRFCPNCLTERALTESFCRGEVDGSPCDWPLSAIAIRPSGWRPVQATVLPLPNTATAACVNGHPVEPNDLMCPLCGEDVTVSEDQVSGSVDTQVTDTNPAVVETHVAGWPLLRRLPTTSAVRERYETRRNSDGLEAVLTLYADGSEPDPEIYEAIRALDRDHVPEILETGHWDNRAYEVSEDLRGGTLADLGLLPDDNETLSRILVEVGGALAALGECGLRHRDLRPGAIMVRTRDPLDLVVTGFGSARLSDYDLDVVSPLEITRYTAPEAVAGGVAAASDWWGLGMLLLEQVTRGACFAGADDQTFLISVLTNGAPIPDDLPIHVNVLLRGLLSLDRRTRWGWDEVQRWLVGDLPEAPPVDLRTIAQESQRAISLGGVRHPSPERFALAAAEAVHWDDARELLVSGALATWLEEAGQPRARYIELRTIARLDDVSEDFRTALALKSLNAAMPLVVRGEIVTPGWLLNHPEEGYALVTGPLPDRLEAANEELWLIRLKRRVERVRERASQLAIELDEAQLRVFALSTSKTRLAAVWDEKRQILPDTDHPGLLAIMERRVTEEEDFIILLSAAIGQFRAAETIVDEAAAAARGAGMQTFDRDAALAFMRQPRRELYAEIERRLEGFARCGRERIDDWGDQFRLERRLPLARALALLAVAPEEWRQPPKQAYVATLLDFYARRITGAIMRGPLTRMVIGKTTARVDLFELTSERRPARQLLDHVLLRGEQALDIDPAPLAEDPRIERRLRTLHSHATLYRRDTGIDGLYLGFPFFVMQETKASTRPRIAPVLLWPVKLNPEVGARGRVTLAFDHDREEVRLNPAFETLLGVETAARWQECANELLGRASASAREVVEAFAGLAEIQGDDLGPLPSKDLRIKPGDDRIVCAAALFHLGFLGQAVMEDLRQLKALPPTGTSLETAFRVGEQVARPELVAVPERQRFFTSDSDPSQEAAVLEARHGRGLLVEGPPGTGKSQTIVNMVADAIGNGKSLLIVCQKQAALEVVNKRLEAAGLGGRIVMVNDVHKDREPVIRMIREQLEELFQRPGGATGWRMQREQMAGRIEALEQELDGHHRALHETDAVTGMSYRLILGDLIGLAREGPSIPLPSLRHLVGVLNPSELEVLLERCVPIARLWLPANFEGSPLAATRSFGNDEGSIETFAGDLAYFAAAERERADVIRRTPDALIIEDPEGYRTWSAEHGAVLLGLELSARERLARWLESLGGASVRPRATTTARVELAMLERGLLGLPADEAPADAIAVAQAMDDQELDSWIEVSDRLLASPGFFGRLFPNRWLWLWRRGRLLRREGLADAYEFGAALKREKALRPLRDRLIVAAIDIGEPAGDLAGMRVPDLLAATRSFAAELDAAEALVVRLEAYPEPLTAKAMARAATREAVVDLMEAIHQGLARHDARATSSSALAKLKPWLEDDWSEVCFEAIVANIDNSARIEPILSALPHLSAYQKFRVRVPLLGEQSMAVFAELARIRSKLENLVVGELEPSVRRIIATESRLAWKTRLETADPNLLLEANELETKAASLASAAQEMRALNRRLLVDDIETWLLRPMREWEDITRLRGARARRMREFVDRGADLGLMRLRPVWLVNPDVASRLLPLRKALFDTVIFDEASQMPVEYALPTLYRSRTMIVSGDEKQMPPTAFFSSRVESDEAEIFEGHSADSDLAVEEREVIEETWNRREIKDCPDLLQLAKTVLPPTTLQIHYRSTYRELVQFSNAAFYANRLSVPARHPAEEIRRKRPIELIRVDGTYIDQTNPAEAERVTDVLAKLWLEAPNAPPTVGVVTFNRKQADLIEDKLEERAEQDPAFRVALTRERDRVEGGEDMGFFVKNVENVQGDERDVVVFSSTFGRNAQGTFRRSFGVLGQAGGERRLNVAVTRAKNKIILVTSMPIPLISDLLTTRRQAASPRDYLQAYFEYARTLSDGDLDAAEALLLRLTSEQGRRRSPLNDGHDGFKDAVAAEIRALGWEPALIEEGGAFGLDFAIEDPRTGLFGIGIECDAPRHPLLATARAREMWRPAVLRRSIPALHRVSSHRWYHEPQIERERLRHAVITALGRQV